MQHSKPKGLNLKRKITASLLSLAILGTGTLPLVSTVVAAAAEDDGSVGANASVIAVGNNAENKDVFWANAKYYDYLTDNEVTGGWLTGITQSGTGHCGSDDDWYPFKEFNSFISEFASGSNWSKPLYFGNFYNNNDGPYATSDHNGPYTSAKDGLTNFHHSPNNSQKGVVGHDSKKTESDVEITGIDEEHQSYQGLVDSTLKNGNLTVGGGTIAPYFQANDTYVKEFQSSFPFRQEVYSDYTKYIFQSSTGSNNENAADNVYFDWNGTTPTAVNYSYGTNHAVKDGKRYFMWKENSGYGIYPFNKVGEEKSGQTNGYLYISVRNSEVHWDLGMNKDPYVYWNDNRVAWPGTKMEWVRDEDGGDNKVYKAKIPDGLKNTGFVVSNGNGGGSNQTVDGSYDLLKWGCATVKGSKDGEKHELQGWPTAESGAGINEYSYNTEKLDHGFGIHLTVPFRVPKGGVSANGTKITFDFAGDDDLWMFITDNTTKKSQLVLDMGGNHKKSVGQVDFKNKQSTVQAYNGQKDSAKSFEFDYSHTYTMDVFYMERGMIESNCDMSFTMTPLGNNVIVTEKIDTTDVNPGLVNDVTALSEFTFTPSQGSADWTNGLSYTTGEVEYNKLYLQIDESKLGTWKNPKCSFEGIYSSAAQDMTYDSAKNAYVTDIPYGSRTVKIDTDGGSVTSTYQDLMGGALYITKDGDNVVIESMENVPDDAGFSLFENSENHSKSGKSSVDLGSSQSFMVPNFYKINDNLNVVQTRKNSVLKYTTDYTFNNNTNGQNIGSGNYGTDKTTVTSASGYLSNTGTGSGDPFEFAEIQADFVNTPDVADVTISKETVDFINQRLNSGDLGQGDSFPITVSLDFGGTNGPLYDFDYTVKNGNDTSEGTANAGKLNIRDGDEITIPNVPVGSTVTVSETLTDNFDKKEISKESFEVTENGGSTAITNYRKPPEDTEDLINVFKTIYLENNQFDNATLGEGFNFELYYVDDNEQEHLIKQGDKDFITIRNPEQANDSGSFNKLTFSVNEENKDKEAQGIFYVDPSNFANSGNKSFTFRVKEVLTADQEKYIGGDGHDDQDVTITVYYDKKNNVLTTTEPSQDPSVMPNDTCFENPYMSGDLLITKTITHEDGSEPDEHDLGKEFTLNLQFTYNTATFTKGLPLYYYYKDPDGGNAGPIQLTDNEVTLKHGRQVLIPGLPVGTKVAIVSEDGTGSEYTPSFEPSNGMVEIKEQGTVPITLDVENKRQAPGSATVKVNKTFENEAIAAKAGVTVDQFSYKLTETDSSYKPLVDETGKEKNTQTVTGKSYSIDFAPISFDLKGTRYFTVTELDADIPDVVFDTKTIYVDITADDDLTTTVKYHDGTGAVIEPTFANSFLTGEVTFNKTVIDKDANAVDEDATEFPATIKIQYPVDDVPTVQTFVLKDYDSSLTGAEPVVTTVTDGNITIKHNHTYVIGDLPLATQVEITETDSKGYLTYYAESQYMQALAFIGDAAGGSQFISDGTAGTPSDGAVPNHVTVFNQKVELPVNIAAKKNAEGFALEGEDFAFTLKGEGVDQTKSNDADGNIAFDTINFEVRSDDKESGNNTVVIKPGDFKDGATVTKTYEIAETPADLAETPAELALIRQDDTKFTATVTVTRTAVQGTGGMYTYAAAVTYNTPAEPVFTNTWKKGPVTITKKVLDSDGADITSTCTETFRINLTYKYPEGYKGSEDYPEFVELNKGNNFTATVGELPYGTEVSFDEYNAHGMTPTYEPAEKSVTVGDNTAEIKVTNKRKAPGATSFPVKFTKQFKYGTLEGNDFEFKITDGAPLKDKTAKNDKNGVVDFGTVDVKYVKTAKPAEGTTIYLDDSQFDAAGIAKLTFTAKETDAHEANVFYDQEPVTFVQKIKKTVTAAQTTLSLDNSYYEKGNASNLTEGKFVNEYKGDIKISKTIENVSEAQKEKTFTADVEIKLVGADGKLSDKFEKIPYSYTYTDEGSARPVTTDPTTKLELKHGRVFTLSGIPMGSVIKVTERADAKYTPSYNTTEAKVGETAEIIVTNTLNIPGQANLDVYKTFSGNALTAGVNKESKNNKFSFTMTGDSENAVLKDYSSTVVLSSYENGVLVGKGTFDTITFPPSYAYGSGTDVKFHVVENSQIEGNDGNIIYDTAVYDVVYTVSLGGEGIQISGPVITKDNAPATTVSFQNVSFQNDYPVGKVQILKSVKDFDGTDLEAFKTERFPVKITITTPDGNVTEDTTKTISAADSLDPAKVLTIDKLPYGTTVKVEETNAKGMSSVIDKPEVTVDANTPSPTVTVTNTRTKLTPSKAAPYVNKTVKGSDIKLYNEKFDFELSGNGITPLTAKNDAQGKVQFGEINFRLKKAASDKTEGNTIVIDRSAFANSKTIPFTFTVKETTADTDDIKTDKTEKTVTINVTLDESKIDEVKLTAAFVDTDVPAFTNEKYGRIKVTKKVLDINDTEIKPDVNFGFELYNGNTKVDSFTINVSKTDTESYTSAYFPVDTVLTVKETNPNGFNCTKDSQTVTVLDEAQNAIPVVNFENKRPQPGEVSKEFSVNKVAQGYKLSSGDFSFTAEGPNGFNQTVSNDANGSANFSKITFKYTTGDEKSTATTIYLRDKDFENGPATFKYSITENDGGNKDINYDLDTVVEAVITVEKKKVSESEIELVANLSYTGGNNTFTNPVRTGSARIIKLDQENRAVNGVEFTLFKVDSDNLSREDVLSSTVVGRKTTSGGIVTFTGLDLYVDGNQTLSNPEYQWYCFAETDPGDSHNLNSKLTFFRIPTSGVYDVEYTYMNGKITSPISGGEGMFTFKLVGSILLAFASAMLAGYVFFVKKSEKKSARYSVKK